MKALRLAAFFAYLPLLGTLALLSWQCLFLLLRAQRAGLFGLAYAGVLVLLARRAARILRERESRLGLELVLLLAADGLLGLILCGALAS